MSITARKLHHQLGPLGLQKL